ncbi:MAG: translational GTPase TypA, partial [Candidatus Eisenbacteria bacterium]|nr:translational GTPase TypA [Candidatus Eisenbacteria bacterium]
LKPVVVINKVDRDGGRPDEVLNEVFDLFVDLKADDNQLDFPTVYAAGRDGWAITDLKDKRTDLSPLLETIIEHIPSPEIQEGPLQMLITALDYSDYVGRIGVGRIFRGSLHLKDRVTQCHRDGTTSNASIKQIFVFDGLGRSEVEEVSCGDICAVVGLESVDIGDTLTDPEHVDPLPIIAIDEPTLTMQFMANNSPNYGSEGKYVTSRQLRERLLKETERDMALRVEETTSADTFRVSGRGILHLSILMENMRREGYEIMVGQPRVIFKEINGKKAEPVEVLTVDVPEGHAGTVIEYVATRRGDLITMEQRDGRTHLEFHMPSRGLIGFRSHMLRATSGEIVLHHRFYQYEYFKGSIPERQTGSLISMAAGEVNAYALDALQDRGKAFVEPGESAYMGQIVGENSKDNDLVVNAQKSKKLTNMRAAGSDRNIKLPPAVKFSLEEALEYLKQDECVEITPHSLRLRKLILDENDRKKAQKKALAGEPA